MDVRHFFVSRPLWQTIPVIVGLSVACSVGMMFGLMTLMGSGYGPGFGRSLTIAVVAPILVSAPVGGWIVHLLRQVESARREAEMQAGRDELTGLMNRRRMAELGGRELALTRRGERPLVAALLDVDDFKRVNDVHGHAAGDAVLAAVGRVLPQQLRTTDLVARWGGEEFALLLPDARMPEAARAAERVRRAIEGLSVTLADGRPLTCTVSIGLTEARADDSFDSLIDRADHAMYEAKAGGKNRVVHSG